jgi:hypothetical protein
VESSVQLDDQVHTQPPRAPNEASLEPHSIFGEPSARCQVHPDRTPISNPVVLHLASECDHRRHITVGISPSAYHRCSRWPCVNCRPTARLCSLVRANVRVSECSRRSQNKGNLCNRVLHQLGDHRTTSGRLPLNSAALMSIAVIHKRHFEEALIPRTEEVLCRGAGSPIHWVNSLRRLFSETRRWPYKTTD